MDLQLHDGYAAAPRRVFTNTRQLLRSAYGTPTYFQFLNESGMDESYDDETLEAGFMDFITGAKDFRGMVRGTTPTPQITKQQFITAGKGAAGEVLQTLVQPGGDKPAQIAKSVIQTGASLIPGGSLLVSGIDALTGGAFSNIGNTKSISSATPEEAARLYSSLEKVKWKVPGMNTEKIKEQLRAKIAQAEPQQPAPVVAALPTGFPMIGGTAAALAPLPQDQPKQTTFAGMDLKTLALLGIGGFLAYKFLTKK